MAETPGGSASRPNPVTPSGTTRTPHRRERRATESLFDQLRAGLEKAFRLMSLKRLLNAAKASGCGLDITPSALAQFYRGDTRSLAPEHREALEEFLFRSAIGRALLNPLPTGGPAYDRFVRALATGKSTQPAHVDITGLYLVYHGSYLKEKHYVIRAMKIECVDDATITFMDYLHDDETIEDAVYEAPGVVVFSKGTARLIAFGEDNAVGFRLIVADQIRTRAERIIGQMTGMDKRSRYFSRAVYLVKQDAETGSQERLDGLKAETGIYLFDELGPAHRAAFEYLAAHLPTGQFADPIFDLVPAGPEPAVPRPPTVPPR
jgi:hypothetical protein